MSWELSYCIGRVLPIYHDKHRKNSGQYRACQFTTGEVCLVSIKYNRQEAEASDPPPQISEKFLEPTSLKRNKTKTIFSMFILKKRISALLFSVAVGMGGIQFSITPTLLMLHVINVSRSSPFNAFWDPY